MRHRGPLDPEHQRKGRVLALLGDALWVPAGFALYFSLTGHETAAQLMGIVIGLGLAAIYLWARRSGLFGRRQ